MVKDPIKVLYIEDDESDVEFVRTALKDIGCRNFKLEVIADGEAALSYIYGSQGNAHLPDVILLDLNLPKIHGKEILKSLKESPQLRKIPVVVLSTSSYQVDVNESYSLGAAGYFTKPINYNDYKGTVQAICQYWIDRATLPTFS